MSVIFLLISTTKPNEKGFTLAHVIVKVAPAVAAGVSAAGNIPPKVRKQRQMNADASSHSPFYLFFIWEP